MKTIHVKTDNYNIELHLRGKYTVLGGKSATGKTYLYDLLKDSDAEGCYFINYESVKNKENYKAAVDYIRKSMNKVIIIDQVDDIQRIDDTIMYTINTDINNSFILIGRAPLITYNISNMAELHIENGKIIFEYMFDEPMAK